MITLKSNREIGIMRDACRIVAETLDELRDHCNAGISTKLLDKLAEEKAAQHNAKAAFKAC